MRWFVIFLFLPIIGHTQLYDVSVGAGSSMYSGDLTANTLQSYLHQLHGAADLSAAFYFSPAYCLRGHVMYSKFSGDDRYSNQDWQVERNLNFESNILEFGVQAEADLGRFFNLPSVFSYPYAFIGFSVLHFNPFTQYNGRKVALQPLGTEGQGMPGYDEKYKLMTTAVSFGLGYKYPMRNYIDLVATMSWSRANTDYLDDVSKDYVSREELSTNNGEIASLLGNKVDRETGRIRGGRYSNDWYGVGLLSLRYYFGRARNAMSHYKPGYTGHCPSKF